MAFGSSKVIAKNGWLEIHGTNVAPADTPSTGVDWSNAPEFASRRMPTSLGAIDSVTVNGVPAYIYFYCSAATELCGQINVLSPLSTPQDVVQVVVTCNRLSSAPYATEQMNSSAAMPWFDTAGHVMARHLDGSLVGPATLVSGRVDAREGRRDCHVGGVRRGNPVRRRTGIGVPERLLGAYAGVLGLRAERDSKRSLCRSWTGPITYHFRQVLRVEIIRSCAGSATSRFPPGSAITVE